MNTPRTRRSITTPAYYLGRPASIWYAAIGERRNAPGGGRISRPRGPDVVEPLV